MHTTAIITAAGFGQRMGRRKQFIEICGKPMLVWTLEAFEKAPSIDEIILVVNADEIGQTQNFSFPKLKKIVAGGPKRQDSVYNALQVLSPATDLVAIHDGARPLISAALIEKAISEAVKYGAVVVGVPVKDTIKRVGSESHLILETVDRQLLWAAQTPQVFRKEIILKAFEAGYNKCSVTDDAMLVEKLGIQVKMVMGDYTNIKVTTPEDVVVVEDFFKRGID